MRKSSYTTGNAKIATTSGTTRRGRTSQNHATSTHTIVTPSSGRTRGALPSATHTPMRRQPVHASERAAHTSASHAVASHNHTSPISSPDVANSHVTATVETNNAPTGTTTPG